MSVYVDDMKTTKRVAGCSRWCHMMADTEAELHEMARRIGLRREWFQGDHYDLMPQRRVAAINAGAQIVSSRKLVELRRAARIEGEPGGG